MGAFSAIEVFLLGLVGVAIVYAAARVVTFAYFKSKSEFLENLPKHNPTDKEQDHHG